MNEKNNIELSAIFKISEDLIFKNIEGEAIIVPLKSEIGDPSAELYSLNDTGLIIWKKIDGMTPIKKIINDISLDFNIPFEKIKADVITLTNELLQKGLIIEV